MTYEYEMIVCVVNTGFSDAVMSAARACGARGGTVINARGTANPEAESFFKITIQVMGFRAVMAKKVRDKIMMKHILDADDEQIIAFM